MYEPARKTRKEFANALQTILKDKSSGNFLVGDSEKEILFIRVEYDSKQTPNTTVCYDKNGIELLKLNECFIYGGQLCYSGYGLEEAVNYIFEKKLVKENI